MELTLALLALAIVFGWNIVATRRVAASSYYTQERKLAQYLIIWLLPVRISFPIANHPTLFFSKTLKKLIFSER